ncbi:MAG TPA: response regulator [Blastocatellia bacterium]|nr:response regulator [Blastocatellia bacterium]
MTTSVLIVEDDFDTLHPLAELLRLKGFGVITASDAEHALKLAVGAQPDLIITDIALPGKSGLHFIGNVRKDEVIKSTPVLVISGCGPMILVEAEAAGADRCLEKPIHIHEFWTAVDQLLGRPAGPLPPPDRESSDDEGRAIISEVDRLVDELRSCDTQGARDSLIRSLKENLLRLNAKEHSSRG